MQTRYSRFVLWMGAFALGSVIVPGVAAQCGLSMKAIKPSGWQPDSGRAYQKLVLVNSEEPSIVGMWHVVFTAQTMNGGAFSGVIDNSVVVWHSDGTEIMNSSRPAQDGNFCLGVWSRTGKLSYYLNHIPWQGNDLENAPSGIGNPQGGAQLTEKITLSPNGKSYCGYFKLVAYDTSGNVTVTFTGTLKAKRITIGTSIADLLKE